MISRKSHKIWVAVKSLIFHTALWHCTLWKWRNLLSPKKCFVNYLVLVVSLLVKICYFHEFFAKKRQKKPVKVNFPNFHTVHCIHMVGYAGTFFLNISYQTSQQSFRCASWRTIMTELLEYVEWGCIREQIKFSE